MGTREEHVAFTTALYKFSQLTSQDYTCANGEKNLFTIHDMRALELKKVAVQIEPEPSILLLL